MERKFKYRNDDCNRAQNKIKGKKNKMLQEENDSS